MRIPNWYRIDSAGLRYYVPWHFQASTLVNCGFSTRIGGVSKPPFDSLNLSLAMSDNRDDVLTNRRLFASGPGFDPARIVVPDQVHSNLVRRVYETDAGSGAFDHDNAIPGTDALITDTPNLPLALHFADCVGVFFLDPLNRAIGVAHAGWRGTVGGIVCDTVDAMSREFGTEPGKLLAAISPAIERHCYEVGEDVAGRFFHIFPNENVISPAGRAKWHVDLKMANRVMLRRAGVEDSNIAISEHCTCCGFDEFFSYRRDGATGRMGGWISLRPL